MCPDRWNFPEDVEYVFHEAGVEVRQTVTALAQFGQRIRIQAQNPLRIKGIERELRPGQCICVLSPDLCESDC